MCKPKILIQICSFTSIQYKEYGNRLKMYFTVPEVEIMSLSLGFFFGLCVITSCYIGYKYNSYCRESLISFGNENNCTIEGFEVV